MKTRNKIQEYNVIPISVLSDIMERLNNGQTVALCAYDEIIQKRVLMLKEKPARTGIVTFTNDKPKYAKRVKVTSTEEFKKELNK